MAIKKASLGGTPLVHIVLACAVLTGCVVAPSQPQQNRYNYPAQPNYSSPKQYVPQIPPPIVNQIVPPSDSVKADSVPIGYDYFVGSPNGTKYYMSSVVQSRSMESNPSDVLAVADIWVLLPTGRGVFYKQASDCNEPGSTFLVKPSPLNNGKLIRADQNLAPPGTIGYGVWSLACTKAGLFKQKPAIKVAPPKKTT